MCSLSKRVEQLDRLISKLSGRSIRILVNIGKRDHRGERDLQPLPLHDPYQAPIDICGHRRSYDRCSKSEANAFLKFMCDICGCNFNFRGCFNKESRLLFMYHKMYETDKNDFWHLTRKEVVLFIS
ncbi:hypothetical protein NPIL_293691 [Nephila pilipes]|uniref:Uncharacterized protein n=1 Tax=Nephila pilipes TaxID=299642 RepID=A0A8X6T9X6_NEPPI|nr:hypothetical protein NPIL_293691 [Nephila pilipes]